MEPKTIAAVVYSGDRVVSSYRQAPIVRTSGTTKVRMGRISALSDTNKRLGLLLAIRQGASVEAAATLIGTSDRAVYRYLESHPDFRTEMDAAIAERQAIEGKVVQPSAIPTFLAEPVEPPEVDEDGEPIVAAGVPELGIRPLTRKTYMALLWRRANGKGPDAVAWARLLAPVMMGPTIRAQERRENTEASRQLAAASVGEEAEVTVGASTGAPFILVAPSNGREAPGRAPQAPEVEVIDAEVIV